MYLVEQFVKESWGHACVYLFIGMKLLSCWKFISLPHFRVKMNDTGYKHNRILLLLCSSYSNNVMGNRELRKIFLITKILLREKFWSGEKFGVN